MALKATLDGDASSKVVDLDVSISPPHDLDGFREGQPVPFRAVVTREIEQAGDAEIHMFRAAIKNPKKLSAELEFPNNAGNAAYTLELKNAYVASWEMSIDARTEVIEIFAGEVTLTVGSNTVTYRLPRWHLPD